VQKKHWLSLFSEYICMPPALNRLHRRTAFFAAWNACGAMLDERGAA
jgi:hypothetical protein